MSEQVQDAGTATTDAGGTQTVDTTQTTAGASTDTTAAPADVEYVFEAPEGVTLDEGDLGEFKTIAKELKLPQDAASKLVGIVAKREAARAEAFSKQVEDWGAAVSADKELGTAENLAAARNVIDTFGSPELKSLLNSSGFGNHPEVVRLALKVSKAISEDTIIAAKRTGGAPASRDHAAVLYGTTPN
jgi:hypothetical protein